jgi:disulfide bond formation protein DsbB
MSNYEMTATVPAALGDLPSHRLVNVLGFIACASMLGFGIFYLQQYLGLEPCPLCILQRVAIAATGSVFLLAAIHNPRNWGRRVYALLLALTIGSGVALSSRHVWLQYFLPANAQLDCGMALSYMLEVLSPWETLRLVLKGSGDCSRIDWSFLYLSIPAWTLVYFILLGIVGITRNWRRD